MNSTSVRRALAALACAAAAPGVALAAAGDLVTTVNGLSSNVSYAAPGLTAKLAYQLTVENRTPNTINNVILEGGVGVVAGTAAVPALADIEGLPVDSCSATATGFRCGVGTVRGRSSLSVIFAAPERPADGADSTVQLAGRTIYAEGTGDSSNSPNNSIALWRAEVAGDDLVALGTSNPRLVRTAFSGEGGTMASGDNGLGNPQVPLATAVTVPPGNAPTTGSIAIEHATGEAAERGCANFHRCETAQLTLPGSFAPYLTVVVRQAKANVRPGTQAGKLLLFYDGGVGKYVGFVGQCASPTQPTAGRPCWIDRKLYRNNKVPGWTPQLDGMAEFVVIQDVNGGFTMI
jgi:hypothetical protein